MTITESRRLQQEQLRQVTIKRRVRQALARAQIESTPLPCPDPDCLPCRLRRMLEGGLQRAAEEAGAPPVSKAH